MPITRIRQERPPIHLLASEADQVAGLAMRVEHQHPLVASMLLSEIDRAELHEPQTMPQGTVRLNSRVAFLDDRTSELREVQLVLPAQANIAEGRISILTPMGAALFGLESGQSIDWPDLYGNVRHISIVRVVEPEEVGDDDDGDPGP
ncbi:MAG: nucleoside diphosphate kinase regulator, partial [Sphingomicrobium sp.]